MKINAIIENKDGGTLVLDFPRSIYDVYEKLSRWASGSLRIRLPFAMKNVMTCVSSCIPRTRLESTSS